MIHKCLEYHVFSNGKIGGKSLPVALEKAFIFSKGKISSFGFGKGAILMSHQILCMDINSGYSGCYGNPGRVTIR